MDKELIINKCKNCGTIVRVIEGNQEIKCCDKSMENLIPNSVDAAFEKHIPNIEIKDDKIKVTVKHVMEDEHYIEWICILTDDEEYIKYFRPGQIPQVEFELKDISGVKVYAYCNKHGLWKNELD